MTGKEIKARDRGKDRYMVKELASKLGIDESVLSEVFQEVSIKFQKETATRCFG